MFGQDKEKERKQEAAIEAARDPTSSVTAKDAEKTVVEESKKAGAAAFSFDPDASPAEKAAAAKAGIAPDFHRRKPAALGVVSDLGGGGEHYDLPTPTTAVIDTPTSPTTPVNGAPGTVDEEDMRKKTGWVPRFGSGSAPGDDDEGSMLEHTTWLEEKLGDKFFGDWYHNAAIIVFACITSWVIAVLGGGLGWVFIVMACCGTYYRTSIRRVRRNFRDDVHRELQLKRLESDSESLEWINSFLVKFWPIYQPVLASTIIASVDQVLSSTTPAFLDSMRLRTFTLGTKPPRLEHVKTYPKMEDDIVVMDWKFSFTPNDILDMTARQVKNKMNPKVVLQIRIGKGVISKALEVIVEDFAFSGTARVKVKLQIPFPHVEKVEFCFLDKPDIDYVCKPLGGDTLGFDINFIPGLESFIKDQIHGNLGPIMYAPNVFPIEIAKMLAGTPVDEAIGVLAVTLHGAQGLKNTDATSVDPYVILNLNGREELGRTATIKDNPNPRWNETKFVILTSYTDTLEMPVYDRNEFRKDKCMGTAAFKLDRLEDYTDHENLQLEVIANGKARGVLQTDIRFFPVLEPLKRDDGTEEPLPESNTGIARLTLEQAKELDKSISLVGELTPYALLLLNGNEIHRTKKYKRTNQPIFEDGTRSFLVTDRKSARLGVVIKDDRDLSAHPVLGAYQIKLDDMMRMAEQGKEWFPLSNVKTGRIKLRLEWKPVALRGIEGSSGGYVNPIGVMRLHFKSAKGLKNVETMGKSDPYVRVMVSGVERAKTVTILNNLNPEWDEVQYVPVHSPREQITLEIMDYQNVGKDRSLGYVEMSLHDYILEDDDGRYAVHDDRELQSTPLKMLRGTAKGTLNFTASFFPTHAVIDPEEEEAEKRDLEEAATTGRQRTVSRASDRTHSRTASKSSITSVTPRRSIDGRKSLEQQAILNGAAAAANASKEVDGPTEQALADSEQAEEAGEAPKADKIRLSVDDLGRYNTGIIVFRIISAHLAHTGCHLEVLMDDYVFPSFFSSKARSYEQDFGETGDAVVRELDMSRITLRLTDKTDRKGEGDADDESIAKLSGDTLQVLQSCLYTERELVLKGHDGSTNKVKVSMKYLPLQMRLDPSESMNNMGTLRVDVLDAADLPSADRNGFSDPYCKFELNGETVYKTKVQKKTLHPAWNEYFETSITSRTAANFRVNVYDWDFGDKADHLGSAVIDLTKLDPLQSKELHLTLDGKSGVVRLRLLFRNAYVQRTRQGSSTFSGTIGPAGKVIGAPVKGVTKVGTGVIKGATFLGSKLTRGSGGKHAHSGSTDSTDAPIMSSSQASVSTGSLVPSDRPGTADGSAKGGVAQPQQPVTAVVTAPDGSVVNGSTTAVAAGSATPRPQSRAGSIMSSHRGATPRGDSGLATISIISASGYPAGTKLQVTVKPAGKHSVLKTKAVKAPSGEANFADQTSDAVGRVQCAADTQFNIKVVDDKLLGSHDLGETMFFVDDSSSGGSERTIQVGQGQVVLKSSFAGAFENRSNNGSTNGNNDGSSPAQKRRSLLSRGRDHRNSVSREGTPS